MDNGAVPGVNCDPGGSTPMVTAESTVGCQVLELDYGTSTTASGTDPSDWGNILGQLETVKYYTFDPDTDRDGRGRRRDLSIRRQRDVAC